MKKTWMVMAGCFLSVFLSEQLCGAMEAESGLRSKTPVDVQWQMRPIRELKATGELPKTDATWEPAALWQKEKWNYQKAFAKGEGIFAAWYKGEIDIPAAMEGRRVALGFDCINFHIRVFVNGQLAGEHYGLLPFEVEITPYVKPGNKAQILMAVDGPWVSALDLTRVNPEKVYKIKGWSDMVAAKSMAGIYPWEFGVLPVGVTGGIFKKIWLISTALVYVEDVFVITSVTNKSIQIRTTLRNSDKTARAASIGNEVFATDRKTMVTDLPGGKKVKIEAGGSIVVTQEKTWKDPQLWWPHDPHLYALKTSVKEGRNEIDNQWTRFGFREVTIDRDAIRLNGVKIHFKTRTNLEIADDLNPNETDVRKTLLLDQKAGYNTQRAGFCVVDNSVMDMADETGTLIYLLTFDNEFLVHNWKDERFWKNWKTYLDEYSRVYRNHPSFVLWSLANEITRGRYYHDEYLVKKFADLFAYARKTDPTRPVFTDGDLDCAGTSDVISGHTSEQWVFGGYNVGYHPRMIYDPEMGYRLGYQKRALIDPNWKGRKPFFMSELEITGWEPNSNMFLDGEEIMTDRSLWKKSKIDGMVMWISGMRYSGLTGLATWLNSEEGYAPEIVKALAPVTALMKDYDTQFFSGTKVLRTVKVLNDLFVPVDLELKWDVRCAEKVVKEESLPLNVPAGEEKEIILEFKAPKVTTPENMAFHLSLKDKTTTQTYDQAFNYTVFPREPLTVKADRADVRLYDPVGLTAQVLDQSGLKYQKINSLAEGNNQAGGILVIGTGALKLGESLENLKAFVRNGGRVLCFEQDNPAVEGLPVKLVPVGLPSTIFYPRIRNHEAFRGVDQRYTRYWGTNYTVCRNSYFKPQLGNFRIVADSGARTKLEYTPLLELPYGKGCYVLCQLELTDNYEKAPAARAILRNLLNYVWTMPEGPLAGKALVVSNRQGVGELLFKLHVNCEKVTGEKLPELGKYRMLLVEGGDTELALLGKNWDRVKTFLDSGGTVFIQSITPEGMEILRRIFGIGCLTIGPFNALQPVRKNSEDVLLNSLTHDDFRWKIGITGAWAMGGKEILSHTIMSGVFRPALRMPLKQGAVGVIQFGEERRCDKVVVYQRVNTKSWSANTQTPIKLKVEFSDNSAVEQALSAKTNRQEFALGDVIRFPSKPTTSLKISVTEGQGQAGDALEIGAPGFQGDRNVVRVIEPSGIIKLSRGKGSVYLSLFNFCDYRNSEEARRILNVMLTNLGVETMDSKNIQYAAGLWFQVNIVAACNRLLNDDDTANNLQGGWLDEGKNDFRDFPTGMQLMAGVPYRIHRGIDNPEEAAVVLKGQSPIPLVKELPLEVKGIEVNHKAGVLFFLQTAAWCPAQREVIARYIVHYANGQSREVPVVSGVSVADWSADPKDLPEASLAWSGSTRGDKKVVAVYSMPWINPLPEETIKSIDFVSADAKGIPILLAISGVEGAVRTGENMVRNGSFEEKTAENLPQKWKAGAKGVSVDTNHVSYGQNSLKMAGNIMVTQEIKNFRPGGVYTVSATITAKIASSNGMAYIEMEYTDTTGKRLESRDVKDMDLASKIKFKKRIWHNGCFCRGDDSTTGRKTFVTAVPEEAVKVNLMLLLNGESGDEVWFDGVMVEPGNQASKYKEYSGTK